MSVQVRVSPFVFGSSPVTSSKYYYRFAYNKRMAHTQQLTRAPKRCSVNCVHFAWHLFFVLATSTERMVPREFKTDNRKTLCNHCKKSTFVSPNLIEHCDERKMPRWVFSLISSISCLFGYKTFGG